MMVKVVGNVNIGHLRVLVVHPKSDDRERILAALGGGTASIHAADSLRALRGLELLSFDAVLCAWRLEDGTGLDALARIKDQGGEVPVILTGDARDAGHALDAYRAGAAEFLVLEAGSLDALPAAIERCLAHQRLRRESERLQRDLTDARTELKRRGEQFQSVIEQLERAARTDSLTGLANRRWFDVMLEGAWAESERYDLPLALMMIDLDRFKTLNDTRGHQRGDDLLRMVGAAIRSSCRQVDVAARYGGDEFCVLMPHAEAHQALHVAQRIKDAFSEAVAEWADDALDVGMTIGIGHNQLSHPREPRELIDHADEALYRGKSSGRGRIVLRAAEQLEI